MKEDRTDNIKNIVIHRIAPQRETVESGQTKKDTDYLRGTIIYDDGRIVVLPYDKTVEKIAQLAKDRKLTSDNFLDRGIVHFAQEKDYKKTIDKLTGKKEKEKPKKEAPMPKKPAEKQLTKDDSKDSLRQDIIDKTKDKVKGKTGISIRKLAIGIAIGVVVLGNSVFMKGCINDEPEITFSEDTTDLSSGSDTEEIDQMLADSNYDYSSEVIQK